MHHRGRSSGREHVTPMMYLPHDTDPDIIYVFATKGGAPTNPDWYRNLITAGDGSVERGTETYSVAVRDLTGGERDRVYAEQARRYPGFAGYARQTATRAWPASSASALENGLSSTAVDSSSDAPGLTRGAAVDNPRVLTRQ